MATRDGRVVQGLRVNEDSFTIQLRDADNRLHSFDKGELAEIRREPETSVMPSYAKTLSTLEIDLVGVFLGIRSCIEPMTRAGGGAMVTVSSIDGIGAHPGLAGYASAKFAIRGLTRVAALELASSGIRVNAVVPGGMDTPMIRPPDVEPQALDPLAKQIPLRHIGHPAEVARAALWLVSDESSYVTGTDLIIDGGTMARAPIDMA